MEALRQIREIRRHRELNLLRREYLYRQRKNPFILLNEIEFRKRYRIDKDTARYIVDLIRDRLRPVRQRTICISPELQVLVTLRFFAKGLYQEDNGDLHGISQKTVSNIVKKVSIALASLVPQFIKFPIDLDTTKREFYSVAGFPNVVGCIDCTHIKIKNPDKERPLLYCNRKGFYSLNVQVVCDSKGRISNLVARWRGSAHDSRIWNESALKEKFENGEIRGILLGDGGYACRHYMLTPLLNPHTPEEQRYNHAHIRTRNAVERLFGQWKALFRALQIGLIISLDTAKAAIAAMAVIYNIRKIRRQEDIDSDLDSISDDDNDDEMPLPQNNQNPQNMRGHAFRANFIRQYFN